MRIARVALSVPAGLGGGLTAFYGGTLGLPSARAGGFAVGESRLELAPSDGAPFHHVALLVPGDRWDAALAWARSTLDLLEGGEEFDFTNWDARAVYFHDPAGSILELIVHGGVAESGGTGPFTAAEFAGVSEVGLVGDTQVLADALAPLGLRVWDGIVGAPDRLAFVGEKARTLILAPPGRGWLPTGRRAEEHPIAVELAGLAESGRVELPGGSSVAVV